MTTVTVKKVDPKVFTEARDNARVKLGLKGLALHQNSIENLVYRKAACYLVSGADEGVAGFAVCGDNGELLNLFNISGLKLGDLLTELAIYLGATKLDVYEGPVADLYRRHGFTEFARDKWDDEYTPEGWDYDKQGRPDVVYLSLGQDYLPLPETVARFQKTDIFTYRTGSLRAATN